MRGTFGIDHAKSLGSSFVGHNGFGGLGLPVDYFMIMGPTANTNKV